MDTRLLGGKKMASSKGKKMARAIMQQPNPGMVPRVALAACPF